MERAYILNNINLALRLDYPHYKNLKLYNGRISFLTGCFENNADCKFYRNILFGVCQIDLGDLNLILKLV